MKIKENIYWGVLTFFIITLIPLIINNNVWSDELFTLHVLDMPFNSLNSTLILDVHPPLYYYLAKVFTSIFHNTVPILKIVSILPTILIAISGIIFIKKIFSKNYNFLIITFIIAVFCCPNMLHITLELRMYSLAALFVTLSFFNFTSIILEGTTKKNLVFFILTSLLGAYTHYFALISVAILYGYLFIFLISKKNILPCIKITIFTIIGYLPWLFIAKEQFTKVSKNYWIAPINYNDIQNLFTAIMLPEGYHGTIKTIIFYCVIIVLAVGFILFLTCRKFNFFKTMLSQKYIQLSLIAISIYYITMIIGLTLSYLVRPIFIERYLYPTLPIFWFGVIILLWYIFQHKYVRIGISILFIICGVAFYSLEYKNADSRLESITKEFIEQNCSEYDVIATYAGRLTNGMLAYYFPDKQIVDCNNDELLALNKGSSLFVFVGQGTNQPFDEDFLMENGIECKYMKSTNFVSVLVDIYRYKIK